MLRPLRVRQWFNFQFQHRIRLTTPPPPPPPQPHRFWFATVATSSRPPSPPPTSESDLKSRNQLKREARRAVKWGMDLASFSPPQIKRILRVAFSDFDLVFQALMLVKRLGPDVREGKRRQFGYIGKLLREVDPELMERLIKATKDSDQKELQALTGLGSDDPDDHELAESESEVDDEESNWHDNQVARWFDGLISKDIGITNEIYSVQGVVFDRQELRKLVRRVQTTQEMKAENEEEEKRIETATNGAKKALTRFLRGLSKSIPNQF